MIRSAFIRSVCGDQNPIVRRSRSHDEGVFGCYKTGITNMHRVVAVAQPVTHSEVPPFDSRWTPWYRRRHLAADPIC